MKNSNDKNSAVSVPELDVLERELKREKQKKHYNRTLFSTIGALAVVAAIAVLVASVFLPVLQIYGTSMEPTVNEGEVVVALKTSNFKTGDIVAFWHENKLLVKRVIAGPGQWVNIDKAGNVYVDGKMLDEPYLSEKSYGECSVEFPRQVTDGHYFVLGDHRSISQDSRQASIGCVAKDLFVGKLFFTVWPFKAIGSIN